MSTAVQPLDFNEIVQPKAQYRLYNPAPVEVSQDFSGDSYTIPSKGEIAIHDLPASTVNSVGRPIERGSAGYRESVPAIKIVQHFVGEDGRSGKLGPLGVRCLFGDARDALVRAEADQTFELFQYQTDLKTEYAHNKAIQNAKEFGQPPPVPRESVRKAIERRVAYEKNNKGAVIPSHPCQQCNWPFWSEQERSTHIQTTHADGRGVGTQSAAPSSDLAALQAQIELLTKIVAGQSAPKKRGRKPKDQAPEAA